MGCLPDTGWVHKYKSGMKPGTPTLRSTPLLNHVRERIQYLHYSLQTEKANLYWARFLIRWHGRAGSCSICATGAR